MESFFPSVTLVFVTSAFMPTTYLGTQSRCWLLMFSRAPDDELCWFLRPLIWCILILVIERDNECGVIASITLTSQPNVHLLIFAAFWIIALLYATTVSFQNSILKISCHSHLNENISITHIESAVSTHPNTISTRTIY